MNSEVYKQALAEILKNDNIFLYWKGRVALYAILKAMGVGSGDEVILPGFTCVVVPNAIKYLDAKPIYVDVKKKPMNPDTSQYQDAITPKTKVIITQNTFGLSYQVDEIAELARKKGIYSVEDCTHGFGGTYKGKPNGSYCDAAFFSTQWNKPFSTGIGGFASVNNQDLIPGLKTVNKKLIRPTMKDKMVLSALLFAHDHILTASNYWKLRSMYRFLSKHNLVIGSSQGEELTGVKMPKNYLKDISEVQIKKGTENLASFRELMMRRRENGKIYTQFLSAHNKYHVDPIYHQDHCFLKYPVLVRDRQKFEELAFNAKIELGDWFCTPLYPVEKDWKIWDLDENQIPNALYLSRHIVNLPTETQDPGRVIKFAEKHLHEFI
ncbi:MAG: DegT/DnrJ/EryC1/StrS family aminotransferase [Bacteroidetes bacterium]|nr:DegT/DnrJ/EryC1/StrS family aminotransferase [Bacteroidota bacterium]